MFGVTVAIVDDGAVERLLEDEVDHAGHRIRAVHRGGAAGQHFDAIDHAQRNAADIGEVAAAVERQRKVGNATTIDQHQGVVRPQATQVHRLRAGGGLRIGGVLLAVDAAAVLAESAQHVGDRGQAAGLDLFGGHHGDRRRAFHLGARDARAGDLHGAEFARRRLGIGPGRRRGRRCGARRCLPRSRRSRGTGLRDDHHRPVAVTLGLEAAALEQLVQAQLGGHLAAHAGAARALELVAAIHQLGAGLLGVGIQGRGQVAGRDIQPQGGGLRLRGQRGGAGQG